MKSRKKRDTFAIIFLVACLMSLVRCKQSDKDVIMRSIIMNGPNSEMDSWDVYTLTLQYNKGRIAKVSFSNSSTNPDENGFYCGSFITRFKYQSGILSSIIRDPGGNHKGESLFIAGERSQLPARILLAELTYSLELETDLKLFEVYYDFQRSDISIIPILLAVGTRVSTSQEISAKPSSHGIEYYVDFYEPIRVFEIITEDPSLEIIVKGSRG